MRTLSVACALALLIAAFCGCDVERRKSDAELGLNAEQAAGRKIYDKQCDRCHEPYSTRGKKGPGQTLSQQDIEELLAYMHTL